MRLPDARARDGDAVAPALPAAGGARRLAPPGLPDGRELGRRPSTPSFAPATSACSPGGSTTRRSRWSRTSRAGWRPWRPRSTASRTTSARARWPTAPRASARSSTRCWPSAGVDGADAEHAREAARLAKADQASVMVGAVRRARGRGRGRSTPAAPGLPAPVAQAIGEQFLPDGAGAPPPAERARRGAGAGRQARRARDRASPSASGRPARATRTRCAAPRRAWWRSPATAAGRSTSTRARGRCHALLVGAGRRPGAPTPTRRPAWSIAVRARPRRRRCCRATACRSTSCAPRAGSRPGDPLVHERRARALAAALDAERLRTRAHRVHARAPARRARRRRPPRELDPAAFEDPTERRPGRRHRRRARAAARAVDAGDFATRCTRPRDSGRRSTPSSTPSS